MPNSSGIFLLSGHTMSLGHLLTNTPQNNSGATTYSRYEYQNTYGLALAFSLHSSGDDYAIAFEFHDDLALLNSSTNPTKVKFYQIKTKKTGSWSIANLTVRKNGKKGEQLPSIIGKLLANFQKFPAQTEALHFVSNAPLKFLPGARYCFAECNPENITKLTKKLKAEHSWADLKHVSLLFYEQSDLSLEDAPTHFVGKLNKFLVSQIGESQVNITALCRAMLDQCRNKSSNNNPIGCFDDLLKHKCLTRQQIDEWISAAKNQSNQIPKWQQINNDLSTTSWREKQDISKEFSQYGILTLDPANEAIQIIRRKIKKSIKQEKEAELEPLLLNLVSKLENEIKRYRAPCSMAFIKAAILYELYANG